MIKLLQRCSRELDKIITITMTLNSFMMEAVTIIETSSLICRASQWTGFYMITASVMKRLNIYIVFMKTKLQLKMLSIVTILK